MKLLSLILLPLSLVVYSYGQQSPTPIRPSLTTVDDMYASVNKHDPGEVRQFTDTVVRHTIFAGAAAAFRDRVATSEIAFHAGQHPAISDATLVTAINDWGNVMKVPAFTPTTIQQVRLFRLKLLSTFPHLLGPRVVNAKPDLQTFSPAGALFFADILLRQKLLNPDFRVSAKQWLDRERILHSLPSDNSSPSASLRLVQDVQDGFQFLVQLKNTLADENGAPAHAAMALLVNAGL